MILEEIAAEKDDAKQGTFKQHTQQQKKQNKCS